MPPFQSFTSYFGSDGRAAAAVSAAAFNAFSSNAQEQSEITAADHPLSDRQPPPHPAGVSRRLNAHWLIESPKTFSALNCLSGSFWLVLLLIMIVFEKKRRWRAAGRRTVRAPVEGPEAV